MVFRSVPRVSAVWSAAEFAVNSLGQISVVPANDGLSANGGGYNPSVSPAVTVRSIRAGGAGASVFAEMIGGTVNPLVVIDGGSGYSTTNANFPISAVSFSILTSTGTSSGTATAPGIISTLKPGVTRTMNFYGGTGTRTRGVQ